MEFLEAACDAQGWKYKKAHLDGASALSLTFLEAVAGSSELVAVPKEGGVADLIFRPKLDDKDWQAAIPAQLQDFANGASPPAHGTIRVRADKFLEVVFPSVPITGVSADTLGDQLSSFSQQYTPFHLPIVCVVTRNVPGRLAISLTSNFPLGPENREAQTTIVASVCEAVQAEGLKFQMLPDETGIMMSFVLEGGRHFDAMIRLRGIHPSSASEDAWYATLLVRLMLGGGPANKLADKEKQHEGNLLLALANYGLSVGHFELDGDDGTVLFNLEVVLESLMTKHMMGSIAVSSLKMAMATLERYYPAIRAVIDGQAATAAIKIAEPDAPEVAIEVPDQAKVDAAEPAFNSMSELHQALFATLDACGPLIPQRGVEMPRRDAANVVMRATVVAALERCGIESFQEAAEGATSSITFGVALPDDGAADGQAGDGAERPSSGLGVEVRWTSVTRETGGPMVLFRSFEVGAKQVPAESLSALAEVIARCNFGLSFGYFDADPVSRLVAFCGVARFSAGDLFPGGRLPAGAMDKDKAEPVQAIADGIVDALQCVISTHANYLPSMRYLATTNPANADPKEAMKLVEDEASAAFDLKAEIAAAGAAAATGEVE